MSSKQSNPQTDVSTDGGNGQTPVRFRLDSYRYLGEDGEGYHHHADLDTLWVLACEAGKPAVGPDTGETVAFTPGKVDHVQDAGLTEFGDLVTWVNHIETTRGWRTRAFDPTDLGDDARRDVDGDEDATNDSLTSVAVGKATAKLRTLSEGDRVRLNGRRRYVVVTETPEDPSAPDATIDLREDDITYEIELHATYHTAENAPEGVCSWLWASQGTTPEPIVTAEIGL